MEQSKALTSTPLIEPITEREREIIALIAGHRTNKEIAASLDLAMSTVKWYTQQIFHKLAVENRRQAVERATALGILGGDQHPAEIPNNLPAPATTFVGREDVLSAILSLLATDGSRLITLHGPGGSGKTRLAIQVAARLAASGSNSFSNGVWFVSLAPLQNPESIVQAIASATGYTYFDRDREPLQQLVDYLRQRHTLLVMDNFEHLISTEALQLLTEITTR